MLISEEQDKNISPSTTSLPSLYKLWEKESGASTIARDQSATNICGGLLIATSKDNMEKITKIINKYS